MALVRRCLVGIATVCALASVPGVSVARDGAVAGSGTVASASASAGAVVSAKAGPGDVTRAAAAPLRLSMAAARDFAARLIADGHPDEALVIAQAILRAHPDDVPAQVLAARALRDMGRTDASLRAARQARVLAGTGEERFYAALVTAQARASAGHKTMAQLWLRHAAEIAPDAEARALALRDFRQVRGANPWRFGLDLRVTPSDNLNGAPPTNSFVFAGLPFVNPGAVPLSGLRYGARLDAERRVALGSRERLSFGLGVDLERVRLSPKARALAVLEDADLRRDSLRLRGGYERIAEDRRWLLRGGLEWARHWAAGAVVSDSARAELSYARDLGQGVALRLRGGLEQEWRHDLSLRDALTRDIGVTLSRQSPHGVLSLDLALAGTASQSRLVARDSARAVLGYRWARPVAGVLPRMSLSFEAVDYDQAPARFWTAPRRDRDWRLGLDVVVPGLDYMGFAPEIGIGFRDRQSTYSLYELRASDLRIGLTSVF